MISLHFNIRNPWGNTFKHLWNKMYVTPWKTKYVELEFYQASILLMFNVSWTIRTSHSGVDFELGLLGYCCHFQFYDNRHWNHTEGRWMRYNEELGEH